MRGLQADCCEMKKGTSEDVPLTTLLTAGLTGLYRRLHQADEVPARLAVDPLVEALFLPAGFSSINAHISRCECQGAPSPRGYADVMRPIDVRNLPFPALRRGDVCHRFVVPLRLDQRPVFVVEQGDGIAGVIGLPRPRVDPVELYLVR